MPTSEYTKLCEYSEALEENWGKPPGNLNSAGNDLLIYGKQFGNVFIGVQPTFGYEGDPMRLLFSRSASPHHGFAAYYTYLEKIFKADAVLHFGTHGSLEFMPGKQVRAEAAASTLFRVSSCTEWAAGLRASRGCVKNPETYGTPFLTLDMSLHNASEQTLACTPTLTPGGHVWRVLPRQPHRLHPQPLLLCRQ
jgi:hypothetical protein